jgi:hypothetical protein
MGNGGKERSLASESVGHAPGGVAMRHGIREGPGPGPWGMPSWTSMCPALGDEERGDARRASCKIDSRLLRMSTSLPTDPTDLDLQVFNLSEVIPGSILTWIHRSIPAGTYKKTWTHAHPYHL